MKKLILTVILLYSVMFALSMTVSAEDIRYPAQQGMPGNPPPEDQMIEGSPPPPPNGTMMQKQNVQGRPLKAPAARETIMDRREDKMQLRQDRITGVMERKDIRDRTRMDIYQMAGQMKEIRKENMNDRCKLVAGRISRITQAAGNGIGGRQKAFQAIAHRFTRLSENLAARGVDVTELDAAIATLNEKIQTLEADYATFIDTLDNTQQTECGNSGGEFKEAKEAAAPAFEQVRKDKMDIETFLRNDMKAVLEKLRSQAPEPTPDSTVAPTIIVN